jgi:hypothetical protein
MSKVFRLRQLFCSNKKLAHVIVVFNSTPIASTLNKYQMSYKIIQHGYQIHEALYRCIVDQILPNTGIQENQFFSALFETLQQLQPRNEALLRHRDALQAQIDAYHLTHPLPPNSATNSNAEDKKAREVISLYY